MVYANQASECLGREGDGLSLSSAGLRVAYREDRDQLRELVGQALSIHAGNDLSSDGLMQARRLSGKRPYLLLVSPMSNRHATLATLRPAASILITDPDTRIQVSLQQLRRAFGLTEVEAQLTATLVAGDDLQCAARRLGIQYTTARARLAQIFLKTNTHRQSDLVHLFSVSFGV
ncbi:MAG: helix-turn-helix transcriptional regulator [Chromatiales bacterium]|nr:helix-turn-helix transcriptional regulator [Chromatiales bacterium]